MGNRDRSPEASGTAQCPKSDDLDAARAPREALSREHLAQPRQRGWREAMRVLLITREGAMLARTKALVHLKSLLVSAPSSLRDQLRRHRTDELLDRDPTNANAPCAARPALHVQHPSPGLGDSDRARLTATPDAFATALGGSIFSRRKGVSFAPAPTPASALLWRPELRSLPGF